jgi:UDP-MurNAc hydroxylase
MLFRILSHAGMDVQGGGLSLVMDPWIVGSTYWRSWWNYPPPVKETIDALKPDFIYLTHIHWDHFQGPSLRRFPKSTPIIVPKGHFDRMKRDLVAMGFKNVIELAHGESMKLADDFRITSYHFSPFLDSCLVVETEGVVLLNANDAKFMGGPLREVLARHPKIDFVFRSHSSANARLCFDVVDEPDRPVDDGDSYLRSFAAFARRTGAKYAIPFASNHCFLHKDTFAMNATVQTPWKVADYFRQHGIDSPEVKVMVSGDSWSSETGFHISPTGERYFLERDKCIEEYRDSKKEKLEKFYALEARSKISLDEVQEYFSRFTAAIPLPVRMLFRRHPITYVLTAGEKRFVFEVDLASGKVEQREEPLDTGTNPLEIHTSAFIMRQCMALGLFSHLPISKRVRYRVSSATR